MTATSPPKRAKSAKRLRRFFRGISATVSWPRVWVDSTPEEGAEPSRPHRRSFSKRVSIPTEMHLPCHVGTGPCISVKAAERNSPVLVYNSNLQFPLIEHILGPNGRRCSILE